MRNDYLWVVEMKNEKTGEYEATVGASISRSMARKDLELWRLDNPPDKFRLVKYVREQP